MKNLYLAIFLFFLRSLIGVPTLFANDPDDSDNDDADDSEDTGGDLFGAFGLTKKTDEEIAEDEKNADVGVLVDDPKFKKSVGDDTEDSEEKELFAEKTEDDPGPEDPDDDESGDEQVYSINKEQFSRKEIEDRMLKDWGISKKVLDAENLDQLVKDYVSAKNIAVGKASIDKKHRENANERKELDEVRATLDSEFEKLENRSTQLNNLEKKVAEDTKRLEALLKKEIPEDDPDYFDESKQLDLRLDKRDAAKQLKENEENAKKIQAAKAEVDKDKADNEILYMVSDLQTEYPELEFDGDMQRLLGQYESGIYNDNTIKAAALITIINDFNRATVPTKDITDFYRLHKRRYDGILPDEPVNKKPIERRSAVPEKKKPTIAEKQKQFPREPEGVKFTTSTAKPNKTKAETLSVIGAT